jgi:16S rRNA (cytosine1402-N4)-methyltransferase
VLEPTPDRDLSAPGAPSPTHQPIMVDQVLRCLRPAPGEVIVDCTLGGGGHAQALLQRAQPGGRLIGIDVDPLELPLTEARLRASGFTDATFVARHGNFAELRHILDAIGVVAADMIVADLGVAAMQADNPARGFSYKQAGPLDMRMDPSQGEPAWQLLARIGQAELTALLTEHADEPHAELIAGLLKQKPLDTTHAVERVVRTGLRAALPQLTKAEVKMSVRRTFQALRIAVNDELAALDALLLALPACLAAGGRVAILTFHSGEDRRVKKAFQAGHRAGIYSEIAQNVVRSGKEETFANRRASAAKLRWAVRAVRPSD